MSWKPIEGLKVIGLGHKARQGKDTTANWLVKHRGAIKLSFADALYDVARVVFGMKDKDPALLQVLGTDVFRKKDPDVWVNNLYYKLKDKAPALVVIPDVRFVNEAEMVKSLNGALVKIQRLNPDDSQFLAADRNPNHPSECALNDYIGWDFTLTAQNVPQLEEETRKLASFLSLGPNK